MKKRILALMLLLATLFPVFCVITDDTNYFSHSMIGFVDKVTIFTVTINETYLPFDLDGEDVAYNTTSYVKGIQIGKYDVYTNANYSFYITHTPFKLMGTKAEGKLDEIDYRLYAFDETGFQSCTSDANASNLSLGPDNVDTKISISGTKLVSGKGLYVSMDDSSLINDANLSVGEGETRREASTKAVLSNLSPGSYESTVYFLIVGGV